MPEIGMEEITMVAMAAIRGELAVNRKGSIIAALNAVVDAFDRVQSALTVANENHSDGEVTEFDLMVVESARKYHDEEKKLLEALYALVADFAPSFGIDPDDDLSTAAALLSGAGVVPPDFGDILPK